jgi:hypothetical protein
MAYRIAGTYVAVCNCTPICPCPVDGRPTTENGECLGSLVFDIKEGDLDGTDLSGTSVGLYNHFPSNLSAGNWTVGLVIDAAASDDQARALEGIFRGNEGGPFGEFAGLISTVAGVERGKITVTGGDKPSASIEGKTEFSFEPFTGADGSSTTVNNAMFGFAPTYKIGKGSGHSDAFGLRFDARYGESADFEFSTEMAGEIHPRA